VNERPDLYDVLTGAFSRAQLNLRLEQEWGRAERYRQSFSILLFDLDYFKSINDAFSYTRGDQVLMEVTRRLFSILRKVDEIFRYGGDEFVMLLPQTEKTGAITLALRVAQVIAEQPFAGDPPIFLTLSIGIASYPEDAQTPEDLFAVADRRLHQSKAQQRGQVTWREDQWPKPSQPGTPDRMIERDLELATVKTFLDDLSHHPRGVLEVAGPPGVGISRFLLEAEKIARLRGFAVLAVHGQPAMKVRQLGALLEAQQDWEDWSQLHYNAESLSSAIQERLHKKQLAGLVLLVDRWAQLDSTSQEVLTTLLHQGVQRVGLIASTGEDSTLVQVTTGSQFHPVAGPLLIRRVELSPFLELGVHIWLRQSMQWEPSKELVDWLYQNSEGFPARLKRGLAWLSQHGLLAQEAGGWRLSLEFAQVDLRDVLRVPAEPPHNLPFPLPRMIDRHEETHQVKHKLIDHPLVNLVGIGGIGKTRLALQIAAESLASFPDGVFFLSLDTITSLDELLPAITEALGLPNSPLRDSRQQVLDDLKDKRLLLVMDSFEPEIEMVLLLGQIIERCPGVRFLVTGQARLSLPQEEVLQVHGLAFPKAGVDRDLDLSPAVQLFLQSARRVDSQFALTSLNGPCIARICRLLEGMPLGIELAASSVTLLSCEQILSGLESSLASVSSLRVGQTGGRRSLVAVFDSFWNLLSEHEQQVLAGLSVFHGGFSLPAARAVTGVSLFFLDALVDRLYLRKSTRQRYLMHTSLRQYLAERLHAQPEEETSLCQRHCDWFASYLQAWESSQQNVQTSSSGYESIRVENENIRAAWNWAISNRQVEGIQAMLAPWMLFLNNQGWYNEAVRNLEPARQFLKGLEDPSPLERLLLGQVLTHLGEFAYHLGNYSEGRSNLEHALKVLKGLDARREEVRALRMLANLLQAGGNYLAAMRVLEDELVRVNPNSDPNLAFDLLNGLGAAAFYMHELSQAGQYFSKALNIARKIEDPTKEATCLNNLGETAFETGDYEQAGRFLEEALAISKELEARMLNCSILDTLGKVNAALGNFEQSTAYYLNALRQVGEIDAVPLSLGILISVAEMWAQQGKQAEAAQLAALVQHNPLAEHDTRQRATALLAGIPKAPVEEIINLPEVIHMVQEALATP